MKVYGILFPIFLIVINLSYEQIHEKIPIHVLKENARIDSLLDSIMATNSKPNWYDSSELLQDSCIDLRITKMADNGKFFDFTLNSKRNMNYDINAFNRDKIFTGYFKYKHFNVFIVGYKKFMDFFSETSQVNYFQFIYKLKNTDGGPPDGLIPHGARAWSFEYKDGRFSRWYVKVGY